MRFLNLRLQNFRNMEFAEVPLNSDRIFLHGDNGQGKSNLLEALGLVTAIRSFRTQTMATLARKGVNAYTLVYQLEHDSEGLTSLEIHSDSAGRTVRIDGEKVTRLIDFIGRFPTVTLCSTDLQNFTTKQQLRESTKTIPTMGRKLNRSTLKRSRHS